jgi:hypothetical protein
MNIPKTLNTKLDNIEITPIVSVPIKNRSSLFTLKDSSIPSLVEFTLEKKEIEKELQKGYKQRVLASLKESNAVVQYLQSPNSLTKNIGFFQQNKILDIKKDSRSFNNFSNKSLTLKTNTQKLLIEKLIYLIQNRNNIQNNKTRIKLVKLLIKLGNLNITNLVETKIKNPTININKLMNNFIDNIEKDKLQIKQNFNQDKFIQYSQNKSFIESTFKVRNVGDISLYKDINSPAYKSLSIEDKKLIDALIYIDLYLSQNNKETNNSNLIMSKKSFIKYINPFSVELARSKHIMYHFNKQNNYNLVKNDKNIGAILQGAFLSMDSLISKAYFTVKPKSIVINIFFF